MNWQCDGNHELLLNLWEMYEPQFGFYLYQSLFTIHSTVCMVPFWRDYNELQDFTILQVLEGETILVPSCSPVFSETI